MAIVLLIIFYLTAPQNHSEAEDVYDFALKVEQGTFADQAGVNRVLALPMFGTAYRAAQAVGYSGRAFPLMIFINRLLAVFSLVLFFRVLGSWMREQPGTSSSMEVKPNAPADKRLPTSNLQLQTTLLLAFSYGFWRYANEAETYILASIFVLGAWCLILNGRERWGVMVSACGILVHLLNLIPLLLIIPLYYLLSKAWKKAILHGVLTGGIVIVGYAVFSPWMDFSELGAQHHALEGGIGLSNIVRGGIALGQCVVSGNFLFGYEGFRELLAHLFPSRMLDEEFFMASKMGGWIPWTGVGTVAVLACSGVWVCGKTALEYGRKQRAVKLSNSQQEARKIQRFPWSNPLTISVLVWIILYTVAVIRTEAGSPELWIMALIPFWILCSPLLAHRVNDTKTDECQVGSQNRFNFSYGWILVIALFAHNLVGGLMPVMSADSDYHVAKSAWLIENAQEDDLILTSYEPILIFYLNYHCAAELLNSGELSADEIEEKLGMVWGNAYAFDNFFRPLESMRYRSPEQFARMRTTGACFAERFERVADDEFGGSYSLVPDQSNSPLL